jgi:hypothetical protein
MIYEFFTDKTSGILTNYLSSLADMPSLKMIEYSVLEYHTIYIKEDNVKRFLFGFEGNTFKLYITPTDVVSLSFEDNAMPLTGAFHHFRLYYTGSSFNHGIINNKKVDEIKQLLISIVREHNLNKIIN